IPTGHTLTRSLKVETTLNLACRKVLASLGTSKIGITVVLHHCALHNGVYIFIVFPRGSFFHYGYVHRVKPPQWSLHLIMAGQSASQIFPTSQTSTIVNLLHVVHTSGCPPL